MRISKRVQNLIKGFFASVSRIPFSRKKLIEIGFSILLITIGVILLLPNRPEFLAQHAQYLFGIDQRGSKIDSIFVSHFYGTNLSDIRISIFPKYPILDSLFLYLEFPNPIEIKSVLPILVNFKYHRWNEGTLGRLYVKVFPSNEYSQSYFVRLSIPTMKYLSDEWQICYVNTLHYKKVEFPIRYLFLPPSLSTCSFQGTQPKQIDRGYYWNDVRQDMINDPTAIKISTATLSRNWQKKLIIGTILLSLGISYLANFIYGHVRAKD
jgi:hypothetical protein